MGRWRGGPESLGKTFEGELERQQEEDCGSEKVEILKKIDFPPRIG